ncbi:hypothetical protein I7I50_00444 [Histoplasma capsulatum G186AR]|uniref:Uncharacterized protein n=1 Tax=Ajellomyces capsulatus TaxID=5037 RepID=A0A8H7YDY0_AJECA|nr:hypothetical protein I7I52_07712 [Histoplasma capsulatum]QSS72562.1 hypothetical protein I7I50_00444 [Histoplasma capsulatum G186AR]
MSMNEQTQTLKKKKMTKDKRNGKGIPIPYVSCIMYLPISADNGIGIISTPNLTKNNKTRREKLEKKNGTWGNV